MTDKVLMLCLMVGGFGVIFAALFTIAADAFDRRFGDHDEF